MIRLPYASRRAHVDRVLEDRARLGVLSQPLGPLLLTSDSALELRTHILLMVGKSSYSAGVGVSHHSKGVARL
jgi:hypothetical protein